MKELAKKLARILLGDYSIYYIYSQSLKDLPSLSPIKAQVFKFGPVDQEAVKSSADPLIQEQAGYHGTGCHAYACFDGERIAGICFYWFGERYRQRNFWPLNDGEAKLVQIITLPEMRGRGIASALIAFASRDMKQKGFSRLYARIWHSNKPSLLAFERAGWARIARVVEMNPLRRKHPFCIRFGAWPAGK